MRETPLIRFNLRDRGRTHSGQPRNYNIRALADAINSPKCQEQVAARDLQGYLGHWPRVRFGLDATEGGLAYGKAHAVEPALVTTHLKAQDDGTVEHRAEFLDTAPGQVAARMWGSRVGGFSAAIDQLMPRFFGFDYVAQPNFIGNSFRGVALDDAIGGNVGALTYDDVYAAEQDEQAQATILLLDSLQAERSAASSTIEHLQGENEQLLAMLANHGIEASALDAAPLLPMAVEIDAAERIRRDARAFRAADLPVFVAPVQEGPEPPGLYQRLMARFVRRNW